MVSLLFEKPTQDITAKDVAERALINKKTFYAHYPSVRAVLQEIENLCISHQKITPSSECRDFNHRAALLLQSLEEKGFFPLADRMMDLLACCNPKDISQCDSLQRARDILERLRYLARESLECDKDQRSD